MPPATGVRSLVFVGGSLAGIAVGLAIQARLARQDKQDRERYIESEVKRRLDLQQQQQQQLQQPARSSLPE